MICRGFKMDQKLIYSVTVNGDVLLENVSYEMASMFLSKMEEQKRQVARIVAVTEDGKTLLHD